jgi:hypothetical protein
MGSSMSKPKNKPKNKGGRPRVDARAIGLRLPPDQLDALDAWIAKLSDPKLTRPEAIRRLLQQALAVPQQHSIEDKIALAEKIIEKTEIPEKRSPDRGLAMLKKGKAEAALAGLKAHRRKLRDGGDAD